MSKLSKLEYKNCNSDIELQVKSINYSGRTVTFYAAAFNSIDSHQDRIAPAAFLKTIQENKSRIKWLNQHDREQLIGRVLELQEDEFGLLCTAKASEHQLGNDVLALESDRAYEHSIGFQVIKYYFEGEVRVITEVKLREVSSVTWGSNADTPTIAMKSLSFEQKKDYLEEELKSLSDDLKKLNADREKVELLQLQILQINEAVQQVFIEKSLKENAEPEINSTLEIPEPTISAEDILAAFMRGYNKNK